LFAALASALAIAVTIGFVSDAMASPLPNASFVKKMLAESPPADDGRIVPGWRMGKVHLGMGAADLIAALGPPSNTNVMVAGSWAQYSWIDATGAELLVEVGQGRVARIRTGSVDTHSPTAYSTAEGLRSGLSELEAVAKIGMPDSSRTSGEVAQHLYCYKTGIWFTLHPSRLVTAQIVIQVKKDLWPCKM
jgi:hypothetical protein